MAHGCLIRMPRMVLFKACVQGVDIRLLCCIAAMIRPKICSSIIDSIDDRCWSSSEFNSFASLADKTLLVFNSDCRCTLLMMVLLLLLLGATWTCSTFKLSNALAAAAADNTNVVKHKKYNPTEFIINLCVLSDLSRKLVFFFANILFNNSIDMDF